MNNRKQIFISADIEGTAGAFCWEAGRKGTEEYRRQCEIMTEEVLTVVRALNQKYASCEIVIRDAHATGDNLDFTRFPANCKIIRGWNGDPFCMMHGLEPSFDFAILLGYHSCAGTGGSPLAHTLNSRKYDVLKLNGEILSEFALSYYTAVMCGVPVALVSGDAAMCREIREYDPDIRTVEAQVGIGDAVVACAPEYVRELLAEAVMAIGESDHGNARTLPDEFQLDVRYFSHGEAERNSYYPGCEQIDAKTVRFVTDDFYEVLRALMFI